jgi:hypothetical protein
MKVVHLDGEGFMASILRIAMASLIFFVAFTLH